MLFIQQIDIRTITEPCKRVASFENVEKLMFIRMDTKYFKRTRTLNILLLII